jgi:hypothetical protein
MQSDIRNKVLQGLAGLAAGCGLGCLLLQVEQEVSEGRFVRDDQSTTSLVGLGGSKYRRRAWSGKFGVFPSVFAHFTGFIKGNRNAHYYRWKAVARITGRTVGSARKLRRIGQNAAVTDKINSGQKMNALFAIRYSLFALLRSAHV